jgi:hypothetical protein
MNEQSPRRSWVQWFDDTVEALAKRTRNLGTLVAAIAVIVTTIGGAWLYFSPTTYGAIVALGKGFLSHQEQPVAKNETPPAPAKAPSETTARSQVKCKRNLTELVEALEVHRNQASVRHSWTHQQLFQDSVMGGSFCIVAKMTNAEVATLANGFRSLLQSSMHFKGEWIRVYVSVDTRERPNIQRSANVLARGTLNDFERDPVGQYELHLTDGTLSGDGWAEALQETSKAD